ncbi:MAG TPA: methionyl-tRNA formyltransferase [Chloroflexi bacterium]|jgi:methionyl-tRNA formyltransferase|nr:methionyl-tRNA formyltransferase [Chloroflexota bacterium]
MARVVFLGTPEFGVPVLEALHRHHEVVAVVTQPDRPSGRGRRLVAPPIKERALDLGLPVMQPASLRRDRAAVAALRELDADLFVIAAYGQILRQEVLDIPCHGCIGVHASLLPAWRGAAPIAAAILHGESETGITLMLTDAGMDTGAIIAQRRLTIAPDDTTATLSARLAELGAELLIDTLPDWLAGAIQAQPQDDDAATYAPPFDKSAGHIDWSRTAGEIDRLIRAMTPWPGAFTSLQGKNLHILRAQPLPDHHTSEEPGTVIETEEGPGVATGHGVLLLREVQIEGKRPVAADAFARGRRDLIGSMLS